MKDSAATIKDIARAIEQLAAIRVRQQVKGLGGNVLDREAQEVRNQIVHLAEALPVTHAECELADNAAGFAGL